MQTVKGTILQPDKDAELAASGGKRALKMQKKGLFSETLTPSQDSAAFVSRFLE